MCTRWVTSEKRVRMPTSSKVSPAKSTAERDCASTAAATPPAGGTPSAGKHAMRKAAAAAAAEAKAAAAEAKAAAKGVRRASGAAEALPALAPFVPRMLREQVAAAQRQNPGRVQASLDCNGCNPKICQVNIVLGNLARSGTDTIYTCTWLTPGLTLCVRLADNLTTDIRGTICSWRIELLEHTLTNIDIDIHG